MTFKWIFYVTEMLKWPKRVTECRVTGTATIYLSLASANICTRCVRDKPVQPTNILLHRTKTFCHMHLNTNAS